MRSQVEQWMTLHAAILLFATIGLFAFSSLSYLYLPASASFLFLFGWKYQYDKSLIFLSQAANIITSLRLAGLLFISTCFSSIPLLYIGLLAFVILILDGLDGYFARRQNTASVFGEYLDMETDAFYVLSLSMVLFQLDLFEIWILGIGLLRYAYFLVLKNVKAPKQKEARAFRARLIAVLLMAAMALCFILPPVVHQPIMVIASGLVLYSFGESFWVAMSQG